MISRESLASRDDPMPGIVDLSEVLADSDIPGTFDPDSRVDWLEDITMTDIYEGETDPNQEFVEHGIERFDLLVEQELRQGETDDFIEAIQEGLAYIPSIDPPIVPASGRWGGAMVAAGFGLSATRRDDPPTLRQDADNRYFEHDDDFTALVRQVLRADCLTSHLADRLHIQTVLGRVIVHGIVDDLDDTDNIVAVISEIRQVRMVCDHTRIGFLYRG